jgi:hypothetical protein
MASSREESEYHRPEEQVLAGRAGGKGVRRRSWKGRGGNESEWARELDEERREKGEEKEESEERNAHLDWSVHDSGKRRRRLEDDRGGRGGGESLPKADGVSQRGRMGREEERGREGGGKKRKKKTNLSGQLDVGNLASQLVESLDGIPRDSSGKTRARKGSGRGLLGERSKRELELEVDSEGRQRRGGCRARRR